MMRRKKASLKDYLIIGSLILAVVVLAGMVWNIFEKQEVARRAAAESKRELAHLLEREENLSLTLAELTTARGEEAALRETYGVARPGEEVIIVVPSPEREELEALPWWRSVLGWFGL